MRDDRTLWDTRLTPGRNRLTPVSPMRDCATPGEVQLGLEPASVGAVPDKQPDRRREPRLRWLRLRAVQRLAALWQGDEDALVGSSPTMTAHLKDA